MSALIEAGRNPRLAGLMGAGRTEVARLFSAQTPWTRARFTCWAKRFHIQESSDAVRHGVGYLSEDRKRYGLTLSLDVEANIGARAFEKFLGLLVG